MRKNTGYSGYRASFVNEIKGLAVPKPLGTHWVPLGTVRRQVSLDEIVKLIYKDTYNFYQKWKSISSPAEWDALMEDVRDLNEKYPYPLCRRILLELVEIIEDGFKEKEV